MRLAGAASADSAWNDLVVICAGTMWDGVKMQDRHLAESLTAFAPVLYVDPPISRLSAILHPQLAASLKGPRLRLVAPSLARLTPVALPGRSRPGMTGLTTRILRHAIRSATATLGGTVRAVIATSPVFNPLGACNEQLKVYWVTDDFAAGGTATYGLSASQMGRGERRVSAAADLIVAVSPPLADTWRARGFQTVMLPNGCDSSLFAMSDNAPIPTDVRLAPPIAGFIGHVGDRIDLRLLDAIADRGRSVLLVGPRHPRFAVQQMERLLARPTVQWVGPKRFEELPSYQRVIDVGLVPYADTAFNRVCIPLKTLEYLAAGRPVVATDLPALRWLNTELVSIASEPHAFADAVDCALSQPRSIDMVTRRREFAAQHDWRERAKEFAKILGLRSAWPKVDAPKDVA